MRRTVLADACQHVLEALQSSGMSELFDQMRHLTRETTKPFFTAAFNSHATYRIATARFGETERKVAKILGLDALEDHQWWTQVIEQSGDRGSRDVFLMAENIRFTKRQLPKLIGLIAPEDVPKEFYEKDPKKRLKNEVSGITIILIEEKEQRSTPGRIIQALDSVCKLYEACAELEKLPTNDLAVVACDSGSDKSFDLIGLSKPIEGVRKIVLDIWDRVVFYRETQSSHRIQNIAESLPVLDEISRLRKNSSLSAEAAEILRRKVIEAATQFQEAGAVIPELYDSKTHEPRQLMAPEPKLLAKPRALASANSEEEAPTESPEDSWDIERHIKDLPPDEADKIIEKLRGLRDESDDQTEN